jgi:hemoglobin
VIDGEGIPTLIQWAGGSVALTRLINAFYDRVEADELLSPFFPGGVSQTHRDHVTAWWIEVLGGPATYTEQLGGYETMLSHHRGLGITGAQRLRFATTMSQAADDVDLPADPEFRAALIGYLEWGTRLAWANSQQDAQPVAHAPVPRWGWGVAPPYQP